MWGPIIRSKYRCGTTGLPNIDPKRKGSNFWNGLNQTWEKFRKNLHWEMGNGNTIRFWLDNWLPDGDNLSSLCTTTIPEIHLNVPISHFVKPNGEWGSELLQNLLRDNVLQRILNHPTSSTSN